MSIRDLVPGIGRRGVPAPRVEESDLVSFHRDMNRLFDAFFSGRDLTPDWSGGRWPEAAFTPRVDVSETDRALQVVAELPGLDEKDVTVEVNDEHLTIRGEKHEERREEKGEWRQVETTYGHFHRMIDLPAAVDGAKAKASFKKGVLSITLPKRPEADSARKRIAINAG